MTGAVITHLAVIGGSPVPPLIQGFLAGIILSRRFSQLVRLLRDQTIASAANAP